MTVFFNEDKSMIFRDTPKKLARAVVLSGGSVYDDTYYGGDNLKLLAEESSMDYDRLRETRATGRAAFIAESEEGKFILDPVNNPTIVMYSGAEDGSDVVWAPLGTMRVTAADATPLTDGRWIVSVDLSDQSEIIREAIWKEPFQTGGGTYKAAMEAILADRGNPADVTLFLYEYTTNNAPDLFYGEDEDPWAALYNLSQSAQSEIYFEKNGWLIIDSIPDPSGTSVYTLGSDDFGIEYDRRSYRVNRRDIYNGVICRGSAPWLLFPISGEYWDDDPASETWRGGQFGERPKKIDSPIAVDNAQCAEIAEAEFKKIAGVSEEVTFQSLKDPYMSVGQIIAVDGSSSRYTLDRLSYPMGSGTMSGTLRRKRF